MIHITVQYKLTQNRLRNRINTNTTSRRRIRLVYADTTGNETGYKFRMSTRHVATRGRTLIHMMRPKKVPARQFREIFHPNMEMSVLHGGRGGLAEATATPNRNAHMRGHTGQHDAESRTQKKLQLQMKI